MSDHDDETTRDDGAEPFGRRFLEELRSLGGGLSWLSYRTIQRLKDADRDAFVRVMREVQPLLPYRAVRLMQELGPEELAREITRQREVAAATAAALTASFVFPAIFC